MDIWYVKPWAKQVNWAVSLNTQVVSGWIAIQTETVQCQNFKFLTTSTQWLLILMFMFFPLHQSGVKTQRKIYTFFFSSCHTIPQTIRQYNTPMPLEIQKMLMII